MTFTTATDIREHLDRLYAERAAAADEGLLLNGTYTTDLDHEIEATRHFYVGAAVTELATLRGELSGRNQG